MNADVLMMPTDCVLAFVDHQAGLAFAVQSADRQSLLGNTIALARTAQVFGLPVIASISASRVFGGPMLPALQAALPGVAVIERRSMNLWEDDVARTAVKTSGRRRLLVSGLLTEGCVKFLVLSALADGFDVYIVADTCGGATDQAHALALDRMRMSGARVTSWLQVLLELQRDWTRHETHDAARSIVEDHGGGYGMGLAYAREMISAALPGASTATTAHKAQT
jgi:nicotinamidase-related amidase